MSSGIIFLLIILGVILLIGMSAMGGNSNFGNQGGGARKKFGMIGLLAILFLTFGLSKYIKEII